MLTEPEIFDQMAESFRLSAEACEKLAVIPKRGRNYQVLVKHLKLLEGCCRQIGYYRGGDARWLILAKKMGDFHKIAGDWLRGSPNPAGGPNILTPQSQFHPMFTFLSQYLAKGERLAWACKEEKTGRIGPILPKPIPSGALPKYYPGTSILQ
jgi:hypothetical protein